MEKKELIIEIFKRLQRDFDMANEFGVISISRNYIQLNSKEFFALFCDEKIIEDEKFNILNWVQYSYRIDGINFICLETKKSKEERNVR